MRPGPAFPEEPQHVPKTGIDVAGPGVPESAVGAVMRWGHAHQCRAMLRPRAYLRLGAVSSFLPANTPERGFAGCPHDGPPVLSAQ